MNTYLINKFRSVSMLIKARYKERFSPRQCVVGPGLEIGPTAFCYNAGPRENIRIGAYVTIYGRVETQGSGTIEIGEYSNIRFNTHIGSVNSVKIGKYVIISHDVYIYDNNNHPTSPCRRKEL
jgi:acetyltransferase-like isoleucine patch superfamily enzyme